MRPTRPHWRSIVLRPVMIALLLLCELALLIVIVDLWALSANHRGFIKLNLRDSRRETTDLQTRLARVTPLLWTTLPTLVVTLYRIFRETVVSALVVETPFMELFKTSITKRTKMRKSVYVDYRTSFSIIAWYEALKNGHTILGLCMLFSFVVSLALVPLAGGLLADGQEVFNRNTEVRLLSAFTPGEQTLSSAVDYGRLLDSVSASWIDAAPYPAGTDGRFPLPGIEPTQTLENYTISSDVETSQLTLDCLVVEDATFTDTSGSQIRQTSFFADDRDCAISGDILTITTNKSVHYMNAYAQTDCPSWAGRTRVFVLYINSTSATGEFGDPTLISCIPSYWGVNGTMEVIGEIKSNGKVAQTPSFREKSRRIDELPPDVREQFEKYVMNVQSLNVGSSSNSDSRFAELVARYIDGKEAAFSGASLIEASSVIYSAVYTMLCLSSFFLELQQPVRQSGVVTISENRLHVIVPVAVAMVTILILLVAETIYLIVYLKKHPSILAEEPIGLVGAANLLHDSNIACLVATCHEKPEFDGRLRKPMSGASTKAYTNDEILNRDCWMEQDPATSRMRIVVETRPEQEECARFLHGHKLNPGTVSNVRCDAPFYSVKQPTYISEYQQPPSTESLRINSNDEMCEIGNDTIVQQRPIRDEFYRASSVYESESQERQNSIVSTGYQYTGHDQTYKDHQDSRVVSTSELVALPGSNQSYPAMRYPSASPRPGQYNFVNRSRSLSEVSE